MFCPVNQDKQCSSQCAIWSNEGLCCSLLRIPSEIKLVKEELNKIVVEIIKAGEGM